MSDDVLPFEALARSRAQVYDAFADFFTGVSAERFVGNWPEVLRFLNGLEQLFGEPVSAFPDALPEPVALDRSFARLFLGVGERTVPLTASAYTNEHRMMCQEDCRSLNELYRAYGFVPTEERRPFADSVAVELSFFALMVGNGAPAKAQLEFLTFRLIPLVYSVNHEVATLDAGGVADILKALLSIMAVDKRLLAEAA